VALQGSDQLEGLQIKHFDVGTLESAVKEIVLNQESEDRVLAHLQRPDQVQCQESGGRRREENWFFCRTLKEKGKDTCLDGSISRGGEKDLCGGIIGKVRGNEREDVPRVAVLEHRVHLDGSPNHILLALFLVCDIAKELGFGGGGEDSAKMRWENGRMKWKRKNLGRSLVLGHRGPSRILDSTIFNLNQQDSGVLTPQGQHFLGIHVRNRKHVSHIMGGLQARQAGECHCAPYLGVSKGGDQK
jgi:hypothetical protein